MEMKWYNFETMFHSLKTELRVYLKKHNIKYELSGVLSGWHFEIYATEAQKNAINNYINSVSITEVI